MKKRLLFFFISIAKCQENYKNIRKDEELNYTKINARIEKSLVNDCYKNNNFFEYLKKSNTVKIINYIKKYRPNFIYLGLPEFLDFFTQLSYDVFSSILKNEYDHKLIKLILKTTTSNNYLPDNFPLISLCVCSFLQDFFDLLFNESYFLKNRNKWKQNFLSSLKHVNLVDCSLPKNIDEIDDEVFMKGAMELIYLKNVIHLILHFSGSKKTSTKYKVSLKNINFYKFINNKIYLNKISTISKKSISSLRNRISNNSLKQGNIQEKDKIYLYLHHCGYKLTEISTDNFNQSQSSQETRRLSYDSEFLKAPFLGKKLDIGFIEGLTFNLRKEQDFNFFMGLLQYYAESSEQKIVCLYKEKSYAIEIMKITVNVNYILEFYKLKNNITSEFIKKCKRKRKKFIDTVFLLEASSKEYYFSKRDGYSKCFYKFLRLSCSHFVEERNLEKFLVENKNRCVKCVYEVFFDGYLEAELFTKNE